MAAFPSSSLAAWCRTLKHGLSAGLDPRRVMRMQTTKGPPAMRPVAEAIAARLDQGDGFTEALAPHADRFPVMFLAMVEVGEQTGHLDQIFAELADYFEKGHQLKRQFIARITGPLIQAVVAVLVIAVLILVLGLIADSKGGEPLDATGLGLSGPSGAVTFLVAVGLLVGGGFLAFKLATKSLKGREKFEALLLRVPGIGPCVKAIAMSRFCLGMRMTLDSSMATADALGLSLRATGNAAFARHEPTIRKRVRKGREVARALADAPEFGRQFLEIVEVGEASGQLPEAMGRQSEHYREEAERKMGVAAQMAAFGIWGLVAIFIIVAIFRIFSVYLGALGG